MNEIATLQEERRAIRADLAEGAGAGGNGAPDSGDAGQRRQIVSELKFVIAADRVAPVLAWARPRMGTDPDLRNPDLPCRITDLHLDTARLDVFHQQDSFGRGRYSIRRYDAQERVTLDRKLQKRRWRVRRRSPLPLEAMGRLALPAVRPGWAGFWFHRRLLLRGLGPVCQVSFERLAWDGASGEGPIRLVIDRNLRALPAVGFWFREEEGLAFAPDLAVLQLRFPRKPPVVFKELIEVFALDPQGFSRYRRAVTALGLLPETQESDAVNALSIHA